MEITNILKDKIILAVETLENQGVLPKDLKKDSITVEKPKDESFGELSTNVSMVLAKQADIKPRDLAGYLIKILKKDQMIESAQIAGPGFINFIIYKQFWIKLIKKF